eukprot:756211-Hanusia_phi.AAC.4
MPEQQSQTSEGAQRTDKCSPGWMAFFNVSLRPTYRFPRWVKLLTSRLMRGLKASCLRCQSSAKQRQAMLEMYIATS